MAPKTNSRRTRIIWPLFLAASTSAVITRSQEAVPFPVEAAIRVQKFADGTPVAVSADGAWLAYTVQDVEKVKAIDLESYNRTGVSPMASGTDIWVENIGKSTARNLTNGQGDNWCPIWSPDGRYLAFLSTRDGGGHARLWLWDKNTKELRKISNINISGDGFEWTRDSRGLLATILPGQDNPGAPFPKTSKLAEQPQHPNASTAPKVLIYKAGLSSDPKQEPQSDPWSLDLYLKDMALVAIDSGKSEIIVHDKRIASYRLSPDGARVAYAQPKRFEKAGTQQILFDLAVVDLSIKQDKVLATDIRFDFDGAAFSWSPDGERLAFHTGGGEERNYDCYVVDIPGGIPRNVTKLPAMKHSAARKSAAPVWDAKGDSIYFLREGAVWQAGSSGGKAQEIGAVGGREVIEIISIVERLLWRPHGDQWIVVVTHDNDGKQDGIYGFDVVTGQSKRLVEKGQCYTCANSLDHFMVTAGGRQVVYFAEDAQHPKDLWISDAAFGKAMQLTHLNGQFDRYRKGAARLVHWLSDTGEPLQGALLMPANFKEGVRYPLIVWVYGGRLLSDNFDHFGLAYAGALNMQLFATRGYAVLLPDAPLHAGTPMLDLAATVLPGVNKVIEMGIADPDRLGVMGQSYGGYSTLGLIVRTTRFKAAVEIDGMADYVGFYGEMAKDGSAFGTALSELSQRVGWMGGTPWQFRDRYIENSPVFYLDKVETPLLIVHGSNDMTVAPFLGDEIFVGLRRLGKEVVYAKYEGEGHSPLDWNYADQVDFCNRIIAWFNLHLAETPPAEAVRPGK